VVADTILPVVGFRPSTEVVESYRGVAAEVHVVGDCAEPAKLLHAAHDGARIGREI
jgi:hypothetical protein